MSVSLLASAFLIGLMSSFHCLGMCGPLVLAFGGNTLRNRALYQTGRMSGYMILGAFAGIVGVGLAWGGIQQFTSIAFGTIILISMFLQTNTYLNRLTNKWTQWITHRVAIEHKRNNAWIYFNLGILNGFLPCGMVYIAIVAAISSTSLLESITVMGVFGLGTLLIFSAIYALKNRISPTSLSTYRAWAKPAIFLLGILLIIRGLNLDIPWISPQLVSSQHEIPTSCQ